MVSQNKKAGHPVTDKQKPFDGIGSYERGAVTKRVRIEMFCRFGVMGLKEILEIDFTGKNVLIIGSPASGKTWLGKRLQRDSHRLIHTDSYLTQGYEMGMYGALNAATMANKPTIVEGVHGYRMLRKGAEYGNYYPDIVIEMKVSEQRMRLTYIHERNPNKIKFLQQFNATHEKILNEYRGMVPEHLKPIWIIFENNY